MSNVGDSRAIIVKDEAGQLVAKPLSTDQTPYRRDERARVRKCGARVLNMDQLEVRTSFGGGLSDLSGEVVTP